MPLTPSEALQRDSIFSRISKRARYGAAVGVITTTSLLAGCGDSGSANSEQDYQPVGFSDNPIVEPSPTFAAEPTKELSPLSGERVFSSLNFPYSSIIQESWVAISKQRPDGTPIDVIKKEQSVSGGDFMEITVTTQPVNGNTLEAYAQNGKAKFLENYTPGKTPELQPLEFPTMVETESGHLITKEYPAYYLDATIETWRGKNDDIYQAYFIQNDDMFYTITYGYHYGRSDLSVPESIVVGQVQFLWSFRFEDR
jgi:hypothetical protein